MAIWRLVGADAALLTACRERAQSAGRIQASNGRARASNGRFRASDDLIAASNDRHVASVDRVKGRNDLIRARDDLIRANNDRIKARDDPTAVCRQDFSRKSNQEALIIDAVDLRELGLTHDMVSFVTHMQ